MIPENRAELMLALEMHISACAQINAQLKRHIVASQEVGLTGAQEDAMISRVAIDRYLSTYAETRRVFAADEPTSVDIPIDA